MVFQKKRKMEQPEPKLFRRDTRERRISAAIYIAFIVLSILAQLFAIFVFSFFLRGRAGILYTCLSFVGIALAALVYQRDGSPSYKLVWMCVLLVFPVAGLLLYWLWGGRKQAKHLDLKPLPEERERESLRMKSANSLSSLRRKSPEWGRLAAYLGNAGFPLDDGTDVEYFAEGADYLADLIAHVERAESYVFLEFYIFAEGEIFERLAKALEEKAKSGVEVLLIYDAFGSLSRMHEETMESLRASGVETAAFNPAHRYVNRIDYNYRDHRKIAVIDGHWAYTGGINIGDEYANLDHPFGTHWKDAGIRLTGPAVWRFAREFMRLWKMLGHALANDEEFYRSRLPEPTGVSGWCQPVFDGPYNNPENPIEDTYLQMIATARRMLYITTPYYAVEDHMQRALCRAARSGVDVRLLIPEVPDHRLVYLAAESYWGELLKNGVKIYRYSPGFCHAKTVLVDRECALVGSTNMDYRTFQLHFECACVMYYTPAIEQLLEDLDHCFEKSEPLSLEDWEKRPWYRRAFSILLRLFSVWL